MRVTFRGFVLIHRAGQEPYRDLDNFDYNGPVYNRRDEQIRALLEAQDDRPLVVTNIVVTGRGCEGD